MENNKPMTLAEAAEYLNLSKSYFYQLTSQRKGPKMYKPGKKKLYFYREDLDRWIKCGAVKTEDEIEAEALDYVTTN